MAWRSTHSRAGPPVVSDWRSTTENERQCGHGGRKREVGVHRETRAAHVAAPRLASVSPPVTHDETSKDLNSLPIIPGNSLADQHFSDSGQALASFSALRSASVSVRCTAATRLSSCL